MTVPIGLLNGTIVIPVWLLIVLLIGVVASLLDEGWLVALAGG